jgi:hypothetical protein
VGREGKGLRLMRASTFWPGTWTGRIGNALHVAAPEASPEDDTAHFSGTCLNLTGAPQFAIGRIRSLRAPRSEAWCGCPLVFMPHALVDGALMEVTMGCGPASSRGEEYFRSRLLCLPSDPGQGMGSTVSVSAQARPRVAARGHGSDSLCPTCLRSCLGINSFVRWPWDSHPRGPGPGPDGMAGGWPEWKAGLHVRMN